MNPSLVERVAARHRLAAFIPDKFFKKYEAELKAILNKPFEDRYSMREVAYHTYDKVIPLLKKFVEELSDLAPQARETLRYRFDLRKDMLDTIVKKYDKLRKDVRLEHHDHGKEPKDHVLFHIAIGIDEIISKAIPNLGKAYKVTFLVDPSKVDALIARALKKASPEVIAAITDDDVWSQKNLALKYDFYRENVDKAIPRLIKREKVEIDWLGWFTFIRDMLAANYGGEPRYSQFDLHGMKVVIDDSTITPEQTDKYVKYFDIAYQALKRKKLGHAWYGTVYIECERCDGRPGVDGHYNIGKDHVKLFARPSSWVTQVMVHELGHRYWFKSLSSTQREKYKDLVKVHTRPKPKLDGHSPDLLDVEATISNVRKKVEESTKEVRGAMAAFAKSRQGYMGAIDRFEAPLSEAAMHFNSDIFTAVQTKGTPSVSPRAKAAWDNFMEVVGVAFKHLFNVRAVESRLNAYPDGPNDWNEIFKKERARWIEEGTQRLDHAEAVAILYATECVIGYNDKQRSLAQDAMAEWQSEQDAIVNKPVKPVSNYGATNIDEAFAEAFLHYVLEGDMDADQEASFKAVLLDKDRTAGRVAALWIRARPALATGVKVHRL